MQNPNMISFQIAMQDIHDAKKFCTLVTESSMKYKIDIHTNSTKFHVTKIHTILYPHSLNCSIVLDEKSNILFDMVFKPHL
jgi:RNase P subunit RPR2